MLNCAHPRPSEGRGPGRGVPARFPAFPLSHFRSSIVLPPASILIEPFRIFALREVPQRIEPWIMRKLPAPLPIRPGPIEAIQLREPQGEGLLARAMQHMHREHQLHPGRRRVTPAVRLLHRPVKRGRHLLLPEPIDKAIVFLRQRTRPHEERPQPEPERHPPGERIAPGIRRRRRAKEHRREEIRPIKLAPLRDIRRLPLDEEKEMPERKRMQLQAENHRRREGRSLNRPMKCRIHGRR